MAEALVSKYVQTQLRALNAALTNGQFVSVRKLLLELPPSDVAHILESSPSRTRDELWELIDGDFHGDILEELSDDVRNGIITKMLPANVVDALEEMDTDDLAETLSSLPEPVLADILDSMDAQDRVRAEQALSYGEETAGFIMNTDTITLRPDVTIDVVLRYIRLKGELPENTDTFYVVNRTDNLVGIVPVTRLLTADTDDKVSDVMDEESEAIPVNMPPVVTKFIWQIQNLITTWLPHLERNNRSYVTVAIGCTGGQHRSVYIAQTLSKTFSEIHPDVQIRHRELNQ